jgi:23S rRNA pseudouridine2604 synthase
MAQLGLCSRREADEWIERGWVKVNGKVAVMGVKVQPDDRIQIERQAQQEQAQRATFLLNKPIGFVSAQAEDGYQPAVSLLSEATRWREDRSPNKYAASQRHGLAPAGRLDIDSTGLLVLTQDGRIARQLIGEASPIEKEYLVRVRFGSYDQAVQDRFPQDRLQLLRHGLELDGAALQPAQVQWQNPEQLRFVLTEGKKRQIRRMCEAVGLEVTGLKRIRIGQIKLGALPLGQWRFLNDEETF